MKKYFLFIFIFAFGLFAFWQLNLFKWLESRAVSCGGDWSYNARCPLGTFCRSIGRGPLAGGKCKPWLYPVLKNFITLDRQPTDQLTPTSIPNQEVEINLESLTSYFTKDDQYYFSYPEGLSIEAYEEYNAEKIIIKNEENLVMKIIINPKSNRFFENIAQKVESGDVISPKGITWQEKLIAGEKGLLFNMGLDAVQSPFAIVEIDDQFIEFKSYRNEKVFDIVVDSFQKDNHSDIEKARLSLISFFDALSSKDYLQAVELFGGSYEILRGWNPNINEKNYQELLKNGCQANGLQCLKIKEIVNSEQTSAVDFNFKVEFMNSDGTLFERGPCCGATEEEMPTQSAFDYQVKKEDGDYKVMTLPVYIP